MYSIPRTRLDYFDLKVDLPKRRNSLKFIAKKMLLFELSLTIVLFEIGILPREVSTKIKSP